MDLDNFPDPYPKSLQLNPSSTFLSIERCGNYSYPEPCDEHLTNNQGQEMREDMRAEVECRIVQTGGELQAESWKRKK